MANPGAHTSTASQARIRFATIEFDGELDIHLRMLRDRQQYADDAGLAEAAGISSAEWAYFGVVWDSARALAHLMCSHEVEGLRVLEVGCGLGLASLVLNHRATNITATDRHPEAEAFLRANVAINGGRDIPFLCTDWQNLDTGLGLFDLIIGSDILYNDEHADQLAGFIGRHAQPHCEAIIVDPGRGVANRFTRNMQHTFVYTREKVSGGPGLSEAYKGQVHGFRR